MDLAVDEIWNALRWMYNTRKGHGHWHWQDTEVNIARAWAPV